MLFPERPADGRWGAGSRLVWRGLPSLRHDDAQTLRCQFAAFRLTRSVSGFHDSALVSVMVHVAPDAPKLSTGQPHACPPWRGNASGGPHGRDPRNGRRVSCRVMRLRRLALRCPMMRRHYDARRCFELTGQVTPIPSPALVDLVGRVPGAPPE